MKGVFFDFIPRMVGLQAETDKVVAESEKAGGAAGKAFSGMFGQQATAGTSKTVAAMKAQADSAATALESVSLRSAQAHDRVATAAGNLRSAEANLGAVRQKYTEDSVQYIRAEEGLEKAKRNTATASKAAETAAAQESRATDALTTKKAALQAKQDEVAKSSGTMATAMKGAATLGVGAMVYGVGEAIKSAGDFQASQTRLVTTAGESQQNLAMVSKGILDIAGQVGVGAEELSKGMYTIESAGFHGRDGLQLLKAASEGAKQENADLKDVTDALTTSMHDFNLTPDQAALTMSKMVAAVSEGKTTLGEFSGALHSVEPAAHAAGISLDDVYATLAMMTRTGESADQATQNMNDAIRHLSSPTQQMTEEMSQFGISSADVQQHLGERGLTGTMNMVADAIKSKMTPAQQIVIDTFNKNNQVVSDAKRIFDSLPPSAQAVAQSVKDGSLSFTEFRKTGGGLAVDQKNMVDQWWALQKKAEGFNSVLKSGKSDIQTYQQALSLATGTVAGSTVAMDITGDNAAATADAKSKVASAHPDKNGDIAGWSEVQGNFNQKLAETKASVGATAIAVGTDLLPAVTKFLGYLQEGTAWLSKHKIAADGVVAAVGGLTAAWATVKVAQGVWGGLKTVVGGVKSVIGGVGTAAKGAANLISSGAGAVKNVATSAMDWWAWTGKARLAAVGDFVATKASAVSESVASGAAWVKQGVVAGGAWVGMQVKAAAAFVATKAGAVASATESGAAWVASNARAALSFVATQGAALVTATATGAVTAAQWLWNVAMDANPIGVVVLAVTALVAGIVLLVTHWSDVTKAWDWTYKNVLTPVGHWFQHTWNDDIVPPFKTATNDITAFFKGMGDDIHAVWVDIVHGVAWVVDKIADVFDALPSSIHIPGTDISTPDFKGMGKDLHSFSNMAMDYKADGGLFRGVGGPRDDRNLVAVSDGEFWVNADATAKNLPLLNRINSGEQVLARSDGGLVGGDSTLSADPSSVSADSVTSSSPTTSSTPAAASGLQVALNAIRDHISTMYTWGGGNLATGVDCSGLVGDAQLLATGQKPDHRLGTTDTLLQGGWPGMIKGATSSDYFVVGVNDHHMDASVLGQNFEARQSGEHIRMGSDAASPFDSQFIAQYHLDPSLISPPYQPGASGDPTATGGDFTSLSLTGTGTGTTASDKAAKYRAAAQKELDLAKKHDADAQKYATEATKYQDGLPAAKAKHLSAMKRYLDEATKADALAAKTTGAVKQRHLDAAAHDRDLAQKAQDAAGTVGGAGQKYLDEATKARQEAANERKLAQQDMAKAQQALNAPVKTKGSKSSGSAGGWMTWEQFGQKAGGIGADMLAESFGLDNTFLVDPNQSAILRIGKQLTNVKTNGKPPNWGASPFLPSQIGTQNDQTQDQDLSDLLPATHDLGGPIPPGLSLVNNKTGHDEVYVINPALMGQRQPEPVGASRRGGNGGNGPALFIQNYHAASNDQAEANRLGRTVGQYVRNR